METHITKKKISDNQRTSGQYSDLIPLDLIPDIFIGLPVKTLARFLCVSKQYASIIRNRDFMTSYLIKSSTLPQTLIITFKSKKLGKHFFFSSSQPQQRGESSSLFSVATYHMKCHSRPYTTVAPSVHGLICYGPPSKLMMYNPSTRQRSETLPKIVSPRMDMYHYLGYDPIDCDYKVLCMTQGKDLLAQELRVLTLGHGNSWRMIQDCPPHSPQSLDICINGVLYYEAYLDASPYSNKYQAVMSFDVRSERFDLIKLPAKAWFTKLTSYKGKLAIMYSSYCIYATKPSCYEIDLWVLVDAAKHEWSKKKVFSLPCMDSKSNLQVYCHTDAGEFVLAPETTLHEPTFYVLYYDPKKNTMRRVFIEGIMKLLHQLRDKDFDFGTISIFPGQVENLMFL